MSDTMKTRYEIELAIEGADRLNGQVDNIDRALEEIS